LLVLWFLREANTQSGRSEQQTRGSGLARDL
jgi:hypothetical protein